MKWSRTERSAPQRNIAWLVNSEPLSKLNVSGKPAFERDAFKSSDDIVTPKREADLNG
jgi:hypothetical protein